MTENLEAVQSVERSREGKRLVRFGNGGYWMVDMEYEEVLAALEGCVEKKRKVRGGPAVEPGLGRGNEVL